MKKETKVTEPVMTIDYLDEMNAKSEQVKFKLSEIDSLQKVEKADSNINLTTFYSVKLKNGHSYGINEDLYDLIETQYKNKPSDYLSNKKSEDKAWHISIDNDIIYDIDNLVMYEDIVFARNAQGAKKKFFEGDSCFNLWSNIQESRVSRYIFKKEVNVQHIPYLDGYEECNPYSHKFLDVLLSNGWDINDLSVFDK